MASFPFRRNWRGTGRNRPRDRREDLNIGLYAEAPERRDLRADLRFSPHDWTTLWGAAALGYADLVERMLAAGDWDIEARDPVGDTALIFAASFRQIEITRLLLGRGADPNARGAWQGTALHHAAQNGAPDIARLLLDVGADANTPDALGRTPLFGLVGHAPAARAGLLRLRLRAAAYIGARAYYCDTRVHHALRSGDGTLGRALLDTAPALLHTRGRNGDTLLMAAVQGGDAGAVVALLWRGADVDAANRHGHTPLLLALVEGDEEMAAVLRAEGATIGFLEAIALGDAEAAASLPVGYSTDLDAPINGGETPLRFAAARGRNDLVRLLRERGARFDEPEARAPRDRAPHDLPLPPPPSATARPTAGQVYEAATCRDPEEADAALRWLALQGGAGVLDAPGEDGDTALHRAARRGDAEAARRLLARGANPRLRNRTGATPADLAAAAGYAPLAALLGRSGGACSGGAGSGGAGETEVQ